MIRQDDKPEGVFMMRQSADSLGPMAELQRRELTSRSLLLRSETLDVKNRTVEAVMTTEAPALVLDWATWRVIEEILLMKGAEYPEQVPLLHVHNRWSIDEVMGSVREIRTAGDQMIGRLFFSDDEETERSWKKVRDGHVTDVSIGYRAIEWVDLKPGETKAVQGRKFTAKNGPLRVTYRWAVKELSLVPIGADANAKIREGVRQGSADQKDKETVNMDFEAWLRKQGIDPATLDDQRRAELQRRYDTERSQGQVTTQAPPVTTSQRSEPRAAANPPAVDTDTAREEGARLERERQAQLREMAGDDVAADVLQRAIDDGLTPDRAAGVFLENVRSQRAPAVTVGPERGENLRAALEDAICMSRGVAVEGSEAQRNAESFRGIGLHDLARVTLRQAGGEVPHGRDSLFQRAISTGSFAEILGTSAHRTMRAAYDEYPSTFLQWAGSKEVENFKIHNEIRLGEFSGLTEVGNAGELDHATLAESKEQYQAKTHGIRFALTRKMWINDDLGAFLEIPTKLARTSKRDIDSKGYALLVSNSGVGPDMLEDTKKLFSTTHVTANYFTGTPASDLSDAGLATAKKLLRKIEDEGGNVLNIVPKFLIVPPELEHSALGYVQSNELMIAKAGTTDAEKIMPTRNVHQGTLTVIVAPELSGATNGTTAWYLGADPRLWPTVVAVYLRGNRTPVLERKDPVDVLGIGWWFYHDIGVAAINWRGMVRAKGA